MREWMVPFVLTLVVLGGVLNCAGLLTWVERKQSALMQDRVGANRATIFGLRLLGLFHPLADAIKMFTKEDFIPPKGDRVLHALAPFLSVFFALLAFAAIPIGPTLHWSGRDIPLQIAPINAGLLYVLTVGSLTVYGVILAGLSSRNNFATLGAVRASAQMLSYEITLGVALMGVVMAYGTLDLQELVHRQGAYLWGWLPLWGLLVQPLGFLLFLTAGIAETKRIPFDLPEGEPEIIGYFVEYSGMKFGMFFMTDFIESILISALTTTLFLGGWQVPFLFADGWHWPGGGAWLLSHGVVVGLGVLAFTLKVVGCLWLLMMVRWTLPRFRYDQLMRLGWKIMFPLSLLNIAVTALVMMLPLHQLPITGGGLP